MCMGIPMQVQEVEPGHVWAFGRGERRRVDIALVGECQPGEWLLVFMDSARERIAAERAAEISSALDLLEAALAGDPARAQAAVSFSLPSHMDAAELARLVEHGVRR
jgi:hydrogenase expression/formation protein HypC